MAELNVSRKNIEGLLSLTDASSKGEKYVVPAYQRPYRWDIEACDILWTDLKNFHDEHKEDDREYFLGTIVTCLDENQKTINIIDGQQRITSFLLLLRAFYYKLQLQLNNTPDDKEVKGLMSSIEPCIWEINPMSREVTDPSKTHIETLVATDDDKEDFNLILQTGKPREKSDSYYTRNYDYFLRSCDEYAKDHLSGWKKFCLFILKRCIVLPIECTDFDSALTIFGTLNNRGLPLADSDIFKAELYKIHGSEKAFADQWKDLESRIESVNLTLDDIFRYYMYVDRATRGIKEKEIGLRSYYAGEGNKYKILSEPDFFDNLKDLGDFWISIYSHETTYCDDESLRYIQCLFAYPNEYWKYPVSVFFHRNKGMAESEFKKDFVPYLKRLLSYMFVKFIENPTVNAVKPFIYNSCVSTFKYNDIDRTPYNFPDDFNVRVGAFSTSRITKAILLLNAYLFDGKQTLIKGKPEIEHIFPQSWQETNYNGWDKSDAEKYLDMFGNKIVFEKRLNIQAGNGYFGRKKQKYAESKIIEVQALSKTSKNDWIKADIEKRNEEMIDRLYAFFANNLATETQETLSLEITSGEETYSLYKRTDSDSGVTNYIVKSHLYDMNGANFFDKQMIDRTESFNDIQSALQSIDRKAFFAGKLDIKDESIKENLMTYISNG
ncbi:MAG: DUF262 domain-containing HNH endonuclease family protein [Porphyromonadaceae bacterium]|nr:DUF262 domain-containing HNH endonuclease family protein [Porphyromonadaceae bacterium]